MREVKQNKRDFRKTWFLYMLVFALGATMQLSGESVYAEDESTEEELTEEEKKEQEEEEEKKKEEQEALEKKQKKLEKKIEKAEEEKDALQSVYNKKKNVLSQTQAVVAGTRSTVAELVTEITTREERIADLEEQLALHQTSLGTLMRDVYEQKNIPLLAKLMRTYRERFLEEHERTATLQDQINEAVDRVQDTRAQLDEEKKELDKAKKEKEDLLAQQRAQERVLAAQAASAANEVQRAQATLSQLQGQLSAIRSSLSRLLGKDINTNDIVEAAKFASKQTGVRKDFILGMLTQETTLGRFTGGCTYSKSRMGSADEKVFKRITKDLGYNYKKVKVSCPLSYGRGGAMGVAQFMPRTWASYESRIASATGHNPPDPWSITDGVMAMAIKLANDGATSKKGENTAARRYYCGSRLSRSVCANYASSVLYWAENYHRLLK